MKKTDIFDLYEKTDFKTAEKGHRERFWHYLDFLKQNGLDHIYNKKEEGWGNVPEGEAPLDKKIREIDLYQPVKTICKLSDEEVVQRWQKYYMPAEKKIEDLKKEVYKLRAQNKELEEYVDIHDNSSLYKSVKKILQFKTKIKKEKNFSLQ